MHVINVPGLVSQKIYSITSANSNFDRGNESNQSNALSQHSVPHLHALLKGLYQHPPRLHHHGHLNAAQAFQINHLTTGSSLGKNIFVFKKNKNKNVVGKAGFFLPGTVEFSVHQKQVRCNEAATSCPAKHHIYLTSYSVRSNRPKISLETSQLTVCLTPKGKTCSF